jgi:hypothetical protein
MKFNFSISGLLAETPIYMRKLGTALTMINSTIAIPVVLMGDKRIGVGLLAAGIIGKVITSFTTCDNINKTC